MRVEWTTLRESAYTAPCPLHCPQFDHIQFPGAVPRSFVPSLLLCAASYLPLLALRIAGLIRTSADVQLHLRSILALLWSCSLIFFARRIASSLRIPFLLPGAGHEARVRRLMLRLLLLISALQFHLPFWASRTTPNSLAMPGVLTALALVLPRGLAHERSHLAGVALLTALCVIVRLELLGLLAAVGLYLVHSRVHGWRYDTDPHPFESVAKLAGTAQASLTLSAAASALVDSHMWRAKVWLIPEIEAARFNVVEGRSAEWGVSPWHEYLTASLPKLLSFTLPLAVLGCLLAVLAAAWPVAQPGQSDPPARRGQWKRIDAALAARDEGTTPLLALILLPAAQVGLLSLLAHKEWRFISYAVPLLNVLAALAASLFLCPASFRPTAALPRTVRRLAPFVPLGLLALTAGTTLLATMASTLNYPGGEALARLHAEAERSEALRATAGAQVSAHIDVLPAMTGVTLFQSVHLSRPSAGAFGLEALPAVLPSLEAEQRTHWRYDKTEDLAPDAQAWGEFTHVLPAVPGCQVVSVPDGSEEQSLFVTAKGIRPTHEFAGVHLRLRPRSALAPASASVWERTLSVGPLRLSVFRGPLSAAGKIAGEGQGARGEELRGVEVSLGRRGVVLGLKTREAVWICERAGMRPDLK